MKVSTESMSASASSSLAAPSAAITERLAAPRRGDADAANGTSPPRRWLPLPKDAEGAGACDEDDGEEEEVVEGRKVGDARTWSIAAALCFYRGGVWSVRVVCLLVFGSPTVYVKASDSLCFLLIGFLGPRSVAVKVLAKIW